jgi:hypothetical protein
MARARLALLGWFGRVMMPFKGFQDYFGPIQEEIFFAS